MKKLFIFIAMSLSTTFLYADKKDKDAPTVVQHNEQTGENYYEAIVDVANVPKEEMFARAKKWIVSNLSTGDNNVVDDAKELTIVNGATSAIKPVRGFGWAITNGTMYMKVKLYFKDGKYKIRCDNFSYHIIFMTETMATPRDVTYDDLKNDKSSRHIKGETDSRVLSIAKGLEDAIKNNTTTKNDW